MLSSWTDILVCCIILCMLYESKKIELTKNVNQPFTFERKILTANENLNDSSSSSDFILSDQDSEEALATEEYEDDIVARRISIERKFDNDMQRRSFLERDMAYTVAGRYCAKLLVEV